MYSYIIDIDIDIDHKAIEYIVAFAENKTTIPRAMINCSEIAKLTF